MEKRTRELMVIGLIVIAACLLIFGLLVRYRQENTEVTVFAEEEFDKGDIEQTAFNIEAVNTGENGTLISGWFLIPGLTYEYYNYGNDRHDSGVYANMRLCLLNEGKVYVLPTKLEDRPDVTDVMDDGIDYRDCGFQSFVPPACSETMENGKIGFLTRDPDGNETLYIEE